MNQENRFTGWLDVDLTPLGIEEARKAGQRLKAYSFQEAFTSDMIRARHTLQLILDECGQTGIPVTADQALKERNYGDLQGLNKAEMVAKYGADQVNEWRRSYRTRPPNGESLADTYERVVTYFGQHIADKLTGDANILVVAHGNSLRALVMYLRQLTETQVETLEIPTGIPLFFAFDAKRQRTDH